MSRKPLFVPGMSFPKGGIVLVLVVVLVLDLLGFRQGGHDPPAIILFRRYDGRISRTLEDEQERSVGWGEIRALRSRQRLLIGYAALATLTSSGSLRKSSISAATSVAVRPRAARAQAECLRYPGARGLLCPLFAIDVRVKGEFRDRFHGQVIQLTRRTNTQP
jgi:hypothetical protein